MTEVVAALIWNGNKFLACQRPQIKQEGFCGNLSAARWSRERQRKRHLSADGREELGITVAVGAVFMEVVHKYPDLTVLDAFSCRNREGEPQSRSSRYPLDYHKGD